VVRTRLHSYFILATTQVLWLGFVDALQSLDNSNFGEYVDFTYPSDLKDTTDRTRSASYIDLHIDFNSEDGLREKLYQKRDAFNFLNVNFLFRCTNIPAAPAYEIYIFLSSYDIPELVVTMVMSLIRVAANKEATKQMVPSG
jgi:hypothetical protein